MHFTPKSESECNSFETFPSGTYPFRVLAAEEKKSKKGNDMIELKLGVFVGGKEQWVFDYLLESVAYKLRHFCAETNLLDKYEAGAITAHDLDGREGYVQIKVEPATANYGAKNSVKDYGKPKAASGSEDDARNAAADEEAARAADDGLPDV